MGMLQHLLGLNYSSVNFRFSTSLDNSLLGLLSRLTMINLFLGNDVQRILFLSSLVSAIRNWYIRLDSYFVDHLVILFGLTYTICITLMLRISNAASQ